MNSAIRLCLVAVALILGGCNYSQVRVLHASPDAPAVDVTFTKGKPIRSLDYGEASRFVHVTSGEQNIKVSASGTDFVAIDVTTSLEKMTAYTVIAVDNLDQIEPLVLIDDLTDPTKGFVKLRVLHASPSAPAVDIFVSAPGDELPPEPAIDALEFKSYTGYLEVPAGNYRIRVTADNSSDILYDSGTVSLPSGANLTLAALETAQGLSPIKLVALTQDPKQPSFDLVDQRSRVKVIHASPDAPAVDVLLNGAVVLSDVPFSAASDYLTIPSGNQNIKVNVAGTDTSVIDVTPEFLPGSDYTVLATNFVANIAPLLVNDTNEEPTLGNTGIRVIHASPDAPAVDILVNDTVAIPSLEYQVATDFVSLPAATYNIKVNVAGTATTVIEANLPLEEGTLYTVIAIGSVSAGTLTPLVLTE